MDARNVIKVLLVHMLELSEQVVFRYEAFFSSADEYDIAV
jgi:hypothetical protein